VHLGRAAREVHPDGVVGQGDRPEETVGGDAGLEVVKLVAEVGSDRSDEEVQSDEAEGAPMRLPVLADVCPLHEPHIDVDHEAIAGRGRRAQSSATAGCDRPFGAQVIDADQPTKVGDRRRFESLGVTW